MKILERNSEYLGVSREILMENAGKEVAKALESKFGQNIKVAVVSGLGNNGGDGLVAARYLTRSNEVSVILLGSEVQIKTALAKKAWNRLKNLRHTVTIFQAKSESTLTELENVIRDAAVIVDAIFGTGIKGKIRGLPRKAIEIINKSGRQVVAVDVPSGVNPDTGEVHGIAVKASLTVTFHAAKPGLVKPEAKEYVGELVVADIGIPREAELIAGPGDVLATLKERKPWSKKGDFGKMLVIGSSNLYTGAPALSALAALRTGADIVVVAAPESAAPTIRSFSPNLIVWSLPGETLREEHIEKILGWSIKFDVIVIGPGLGRSEETLETAGNLLEKLEKPLVVDADALHALPLRKNALKEKPSIITPHAGELTALLGEKVPIDLETRIALAKKAAKIYGTVVLLKGHEDVITDGVKHKVNATGNPGMTVGGTGDVLTGIAATLLAHSGNPFYAASSAAFINGLAGDLVFKEKGFHITAYDVVEKIPEAFKEIEKYR